MNKEKTLLIMAAGLGSRFGGLKQLESIGPNGEFIIDYSIYDAIKAGFTKVVFIVKENFYDKFRETIGERIEKYIKVEYVFQDMTKVPKKYLELLKKREKPLGTAHAIYCAKDKINEPFAVINADDFYGAGAFVKASNYLDSMIYNHYGIVGYKVENTLSPNGTAKRGVMEVKDNKLVKITESSVVKKRNKIIAEDVTTKKITELDKDTLVCMNLLLFSKDIFEILEEELDLFLSVNKKRLKDQEFQIPDVLDKCLKKNIKTIDILNTSATWYGMTYKEDKKEVVKAIKKLTEEGVYQQPLWKNI